LLESAERGGVFSRWDHGGQRSQNICLQLHIFWSLFSSPSVSSFPLFLVEKRKKEKENESNLGRETTKDRERFFISSKSIIL